MSAILKTALFRAIFSLAIADLFVGTAQSQVKLDAPPDVVRRLAKKTYLEDLAVNDTAHIYSTVYIENGALHVPGWTEPADLGHNNYPQTGVILRITVLLGRKVRGTLVDAAQAQAFAKGNLNEPPSLTPDAYKEAVVSYVYNIYSGGIFVALLCEERTR
jgi:hypothetical protein